MILQRENRAEDLMLMHVEDLQDVAADWGSWASWDSLNNVCDFGWLFGGEVSE